MKALKSKRAAELLRDPSFRLRDRIKTRKELLKEIEQLKAAICEAEDSVALGEGVDLWYYERQMRGRNDPEPAWVALIKEVTKDCKYRLEKGSTSIKED